jgi:hypothetical protein
MRKDLLEDLAVIMDDVAKAKSPFDLHHWAVHDTDVKDEFCGTSCCAMGYAAFDPKFQKLGLKPAFVNDYSGEIERKFRTLSGFNKFAHKLGGEVDLDVFYKGEKGLGAAAALFEISYSDAHFLFCPYSYPMKKTGSAKFVAQRIRKFVKTNGKTADAFFERGEGWAPFWRSSAT